MGLLRFRLTDLDRIKADLQHRLKCLDENGMNIRDEKKRRRTD